MATNIRNTILALVVALGMFVSFYYLERAFRKGDGQRAIQAVQQTHFEKNGPTLVEQMTQIYGANAQFTWFARTEDNFRGMMLVSCILPDKQTRQWKVDLIHGTVSEIIELKAPP